MFLTREGVAVRHHQRNLELKIALELKARLRSKKKRTMLSQMNIKTWSTTTNRLRQ